MNFKVKHFVNINIYNYHNPEWDDLIARQQKTEPEPAAATYTSLDDEEEGCDDNSISNALYRHVKSRLRKGLLKDYVKYNDYDPFDAPDRPQHKSRKRKAHPITYDGDDSFVASPRNQP